MKKKTVWETYHGKDLKKLTDKAHYDLPDEYYEGDIEIDTQFLNDEWVVTIKATREAKFHYAIVGAQSVEGGATAIHKLYDKLHIYFHNDYEIVKISDNERLHINAKIAKDTGSGVHVEANDYESAYVLIKVYDE